MLCVGVAIFVQDWGKTLLVSYIRSLVSVKAELLCSDQIFGAGNKLMTKIEHFR